MLLSRLGTLISFKTEISKTLSSSLAFSRNWLSLLSLLWRLDSSLVLLWSNIAVVVDDDVVVVDRRWNQRRTPSTNAPLPIHTHRRIHTDALNYRYQSIGG